MESHFDVRFLRLSNDKAHAEAWALSLKHGYLCRTEINGRSRLFSIKRHDPFYLTDAASGGVSSLRQCIPVLPQRNYSFMHGSVCGSTTIFSCRFC